MSSADIHAKPPNSTLSPYAAPAQSVPIEEAPKRPADNTDAQYWRYDVKRQRQGEAEGGRLCFKFTSSGSCPRGSKCNFRHDEEAVEHYQRNVCFDFLNKGKCERGPECKFAHSLSGDTSIRDSRPRRWAKSLFLSVWFCGSFRLCWDLPNSIFFNSVNEGVWRAVAGSACRVQMSSHILSLV